MPLPKSVIFDILDAIPQLLDTVELNTDVIIGSGYVPVKSRDPREPMRLQKVKVERKIRDLFNRRFRKQLDRLSMVGIQKGKPKIPIELPEWEDEEFIDELVAILFTASKYGVELFGEQISIGIDYTLSNAHALNWAKKYAGELIAGIDEYTRSTIQTAIAAFVEEPGFTIADVMDQLWEFSQKRAATIAVTETTRAFAEGQKLAAQEFAKEFPDFTILKKWNTNEDDRVCEICGPLGDAEPIPLDEPFSTGDFEGDEPPAHVNCRCWINWFTKEGYDASR